jgi:hypothetical protein
MGEGGYAELGCQSQTPFTGRNKSVEDIHHLLAVVDGKCNSRRNSRRRRLQFVLQIRLPILRSKSLTPRLPHYGNNTLIAYSSSSSSSLYPCNFTSFSLSLSLSRSLPLSPTPLLLDSPVSPLTLNPFRTGSFRQRTGKEPVILWRVLIDFFIFENRSSSIGTDSENRPNLLKKP